MKEPVGGAGLGGQLLVCELFRLHFLREILTIGDGCARGGRVLDLHQHELVCSFCYEVDRRYALRESCAAAIEVFGVPFIAKGEPELTFLEGGHRTRVPSDRSISRS